MVQKKEFTINGLHGKPITADVSFLPNGILKPLVIFVHGFKGFKDWGSFNFMAQQMAEWGFVFLKFNFSHNGTSPENLTEFSDLEAFGKNNYLIELDDLQEVINYSFSVENNAFPSQINKDKVYLMGHSRGGGIAILKAAEDKRIKKLVTWAAVSDFLNRNSEHTLKEWREKGVVYSKNSRTGQLMPLYYQFLECIQKNPDRLNIKNALAKINIPYLIIHGTADEAVPFQEAMNLKRWKLDSQLMEVINASHTFGVSHPFNEKLLPLHASRVLEETINFLRT